MLRVQDPNFHQLSRNDKIDAIAADLKAVDWTQVTAGIDWGTILQTLLPSLLAAFGAVLPVLVPALGPVIGPILSAILALFHFGPAPTPVPTPPVPGGGGTIPVTPVP